MVASPISSTLQRQQGQQETLLRCLEDAINSLSAEQIYNHPVHNFKHSGDRLRGGCPLHQSKTGSSFVVTISSKLFWCAGCQFGGGPADYRASLKAGRWVKVRGKDFVEIVRELAADANVPFPARESSPEEIAKAQKWERRRAVLAETQNYCQEILWSDRVEALEARHYLVAERGLTEEEIKRLPIGYYPSAGELKRHLISKGFSDEDWKGIGCVWKEMERYVVFQWNDASGRPLTIYGRYFKQFPPEGKPKTLATPGAGTKQSPLYFDRALKAGHKEIILVEGVLDAALLQAKGDTRVCAYVAASCSGDQIETLKRRGITKITLCGDPDHGGDSGTNSNLLRLTEAGIGVYIAPKLPDGLDPDEFLLAHGMERWKAHVNSAAHGFRWKAQQLIGSGDVTSDIGKAEVLQSAIAFCKTVKNHPDLDVFFWPVIRNSLGMEPEEFRAQLEKLWESSPVAVAELGGGSGSRGGDGGNTARQKLPMREAIAKAEQVLEAQISSQLDPIEASILLEELRREAGVNEYNWEKNYLKPLREKLERSLALPETVNQPMVQTDPSERLRLDLLTLIKETDPIKKVRKRAEIASHYRISKGEIEFLCRTLEGDTKIPKAKFYALDDFLDMESEGIDYLIPGLLPRGETVLCSGLPKSGKSLLAIDAGFAIATGESKFLGETVQQGRVLLVSVDESEQSARAKLIRRGFRRSDRASLAVMTGWNISQLDELEAKLEDFRPDLVIIDSLKRITAGREISENSAEFADILYVLKELTGRYKAASILIHHSNKNPEATGVSRVRGSTAIAGAVWGIWQLDIPESEDASNGKPSKGKSKQKRFDPTNPNRIFTAICRDTEGALLNIRFNPENHSYAISESDESAQSERKTQEQLILDILTQVAPNGLTGPEVMKYSGLGRSIYSVLGRLEGKRLITHRQSKTDGRSMVYCLPQQQGTHSPPQSHQVCDLISPKQTTGIALEIDHKLITSQENLITNFCENDQKNSDVINSNPGAVKPLEKVDHKIQTQGGSVCVDPEFTEVNTLSITAERYSNIASGKEKYQFNDVDADGWGEIVCVEEARALRCCVSGAALSELAQIAPVVPVENAPEATEPPTVVETPQTIATKPEFDPLDPDYSSFPHSCPWAVESVRADKAESIKIRILDLRTYEDCVALRNDRDFTSDELNWVRRNLLSQEEKERLYGVMSDGQWRPSPQQQGVKTQRE
jgi:DNA primase catalytic core